MESQVPFGEKEQADIVVRQIVWRRLRHESWTELGVVDLGFDKFVSFQDHYYKFPFGKVREVVWELIGLGILDAGRVVPQDPLGYLTEAKAKSKLCLGEVGQGYLEEALSSFTHSCYTASVLLLGVATEASLLRPSLATRHGQTNEQCR